MAGPQPIEWRRRPPLRDLSNFGWYGVIAVLAVACVWLLFGDEPGVLNSGGDNPLVELPLVVTVIATIGAVPMVMPVLRRPLVAANDIALVVRPGAVRTLVLPWTAIAEICVATIGHERFLLISTQPGVGIHGIRPCWIDQSALRRVRRAGAVLSRSSGAVAGNQHLAFELAVPIADFVGSTRAGLTALAAFAPDTVLFRVDCE